MTLNASRVTNTPSFNASHLLALDGLVIDLHREGPASLRLGCFFNPSVCPWLFMEQLRTWPKQTLFQGDYNCSKVSSESRRLQL